MALTEPVERSQRRAPLVSDVIVWQNGMVHAFNDLGEQVPALQGRLDDELKARIAEATHSTTLFFKGNWQRRTREPIEQSAFMAIDGAALMRAALDLAKMTPAANRPCLQDLAARA